MRKAKSIEEIRQHMKKGGRVIGRSFAHKLRGEVESITECGEFVVRCMSGQMEGAYNIWSFHQADDWQLVKLKEKEPQKATSIEDIREHLAKGGRVQLFSVWTEKPLEVECVTGVAVLFTTGGAIYFDEKLDWRLLPLDHGALPGLLGKALGKRISKAFESAPPLMDGIRELQQSGKMEAFRKKLLFGYPLTLEEQNELWFAVTGERIEYGRRCKECECTGKVAGCCAASAQACPDCTDGYVVTPSWKRELSNC